MNRNKAFDCVEMKNRAQARMAEEYERFGYASQEQRLKDELAHSEDIVAQKWRRLARREAHVLPPAIKGAFPITDECINAAKREGRE